jgi:O-antigen/teichoic acid export membrane protein
MTAQASTVDRKSALRQPKALIAGLFSLRYFILRASTAMAAVVSGLIQTFVFARVLSPQDFSIYILIGTFGVSLWLFDLGAAKILFVRQRAYHLAGRADSMVAAQSTAVILLYALIVLAGTLLCFTVMASLPTVTLWQGAEFALFFSFAALNLVWFPLRNVSNAVDEFVSFETLEAIRRSGHMAMVLALLVGLSLPAFLMLANLLWFVLFAACISRLVRKGALASRVSAFWSTLAGFWRTNRRELLRSGNYAVAELTIYNFPYLVVPIAFGLGAPTIILDTVFKIFRGATLIYAAGLDPLVPRQTRAFAEHDAVALKTATLTATLLCAVPTLALCGLLLFAGDRVFALLLGEAATVPPPATLLLIGLLLANLAQNVASCLLLHTGFFREIARVASLLVIAMAVMTAVVLLAGAGVVGFIGGYALVYLAGAVLYVGYVVRKPFRIASMQKVAPRLNPSQ